MSAEVIEGISIMDRDEAERITTRIALKINSLADTYEAVMPMIREAIAREAHEALGYPSVGAYVSERFGDALSRLGVEMRREVVRELTAAQMSTRDIARVVGVSNKTVHQDRQVLPPVTPEPLQQQWVSATEALASPPAQSAARKTVVGHDGKAYTRPEPRPVLVAPKPVPLRSAEQEEAEHFASRIALHLNSIENVAATTVQDYWINAWRLGSEGGVSPDQRANVTAAMMRRTSAALLVLADKWEAEFNA